MVEGVNNNSSNAGLYAASGVVLGGAGGATTAYLTKPYLKNGAPSDEFVKKIDDKLTKYVANVDANSTNLDDVYAKDYVDVMKKTISGIEDAENVEGAKKVYMDFVSGTIDEKLFELPQKPEGLSINGHKLVAEKLNSLGMPSLSSEVIEKIEKAQSIDEVKQLLGDNFDAVYKDKTVEEVKTALKSEFDTVNKKTMIDMLDEVWDTDKKAFKNCEEGINSVVKKAARSIQGKYAMIYGGIAAAVLGVVGLVAGSMGGNKAEDAVEQPSSYKAEE